MHLIFVAHLTMYVKQTDDNGPVQQAVSRKLWSITESMGIYRPADVLETVVVPWNHLFDNFTYWNICTSIYASFHQAATYQLLHLLFPYLPVLMELFLFMKVVNKIMFYFSLFIGSNSWEESKCGNRESVRTSEFWKWDCRWP